MLLVYTYIYFHDYYFMVSWILGLFEYFQTHDLLARLWFDRLFFFSRTFTHPRFSISLSLSRSLIIFSVFCFRFGYFVLCADYLFEKCWILIGVLVPTRILRFLMIVFRLFRSIWNLKTFISRFFG